MYDKSNYWTSPKYGDTYPLSYIITIPEVDLSLEINAKFAEQVQHSMFDGLANVKATYQGKAVTGNGAMNINLM